jgi:membrane associated rhomboid family serine protease
MIPLKDDNPSRTRPYVTWSLIALNVAVSVFELMLEATGYVDWLISNTGQVPAAITTAPFSGRLVTIFASMFLHAGWMHLLGNMLYRWIFGDHIEDRIGHRRYLTLYLIGGIAAAAAQIALSPDSQVPTVGASGAIAAVLGAYLIEYPRARIRSLLFLGYFIRFVNAQAIGGLEHNDVQSRRVPLT